MLSEGDYGLQFAAVYRDEVTTYATYFYNATIKVLEPQSELKLQDIFQYGLIVAVFALAIFGAFKLLGSGKRKRSSGATANIGNADDWLKGTSADKKKNN